MSQSFQPRIYSAANAVLEVLKLLQSINIYTFPAIMTEQ